MSGREFALAGCGEETTGASGSKPAPFGRKSIPAGITDEEENRAHDRLRKANQRRNEVEERPGRNSVSSWAQTVPASGNACIDTYNGTFNGDVTVSAGQTCAFTGGGVTGNVTMNGGSLVLDHAIVGGNVQINGGGTFSIGPSTVIKGNLQIQNVPASSVQNQICGSQVGGDLHIQNTGSAVQVGSTSGSCWGNSITHNLQIQHNTGSIQVVGNAVGGNLQCQTTLQYWKVPTQRLDRRASAA